VEFTKWAPSIRNQILTAYASTFYNGVAQAVNIHTNIIYILAGN